MSKSTIFMFSGQGSQYFQMGKELFDYNSVFKKWMQEIDIIAKDLIGRSIIDYLYYENNRKSDPLTRILYSSPAIFMVEYALSQVLLESGIKPDYVLGASLGELTAAVVADVISLEEAMESIIGFMEAIEAYAQEGRMIGVLSHCSLYHANSVLRENSELAAINFDSHFVVSCKVEKLQEIEAFFKLKEINYQILAVSCAFHSSLIDPAESRCKEIVRGKTLCKSKIPLISSTYAKVVETFNCDYFWDILRKPIFFQKTIRQLEKRQDLTYIDLGPSDTLATFLKYDLDQGTESEVYPSLTLFGHDLKNLNKIKENLNPICHYSM